MVPSLVILPELSTRNTPAVVPELDELEATEELLTTELEELLEEGTELELLEDRTELELLELEETPQAEVTPKGAG